MTRTQDPYSFQRVGIDPNGSVVAWAVDDLWAAAIVHLLNDKDHPGVAVHAAVDTFPKATGCRSRDQRPHRNTCRKGNGDL
jgi:hypothetical protein